MGAGRLDVILLLLMGAGFVAAGNCQTNSPSDSIDVTSKKWHSLKIRVDAGPQFHLKSTTNDDPNIPNEFENPMEEPSISNFFGNGLDIKGSMSYSLALNNKLHFFMGVEYAQSTISKSERGSEVVLGENLKINSVTPFIGAGEYLDVANSSFVYGFIGVPFRNYEGSYEGTGQFAGLDFEHAYKPSTFFRVGGGIELKRLDHSGIEFGLGGHFDFGSVKRGNVEISQDGIVVETATPEGVLKLADPQVEIYVTMGYRLQLGSN